MKKHIKERIIEHHFPGLVETPDSTSISLLNANVNLETKVMTITSNPQFKPAPRAKKYCQLHNIPDALEKVEGEGTVHECSHIKLKDGTSCPGTVEDHEEHVYTPTFETLEKNGKQGATDSLADLTIDLIGNTLAKKHQSNKGLVIFYDDVANTKGWQKAYEVYMRVQTFAWGDHKDTDLLRRHYTSEKKVIEKTKNIIRRLNLARGDSRTFLADKKNWKTISTVMAEELADLIDPSQTLPLCGFGKAMKKAMEDPTKRQQFAQRRYQQGSKKPAYMSQKEALDHVYSSLAKSIPIIVEAISREDSFPVVPYGYVPYDPEKHDLLQVNWQRLAIQEDSPIGGIINVKVPQHHYELAIPVKLGLRSFPKFACALVDSSDTMRYGLPNKNDPGSTTFIPWGDKSRYHYSLKAFWGIIEDLAQRHILTNIEITAGDFSNETRIRQGLDEAKDVLLNPQFGMTTISLDAVTAMLSGEKSVFLTISDGDVQKWDSIKATFIQGAKRHYYTHIQIGPSSNMTRSLKAAGLNVCPVNTGEELEYFAIDMTRSAYDQYVQEYIQHLRGTL